MLQLLFSSLRFYWRSHLSVLLGITLASAVLTGSLLVGDSVDGSLRKFALQRLGDIHYTLHTPNRFFARNLAERIAGDTAAVLHLRGMAIVENKQINQVQVLGCDSSFWQLNGLDIRLGENEVALNEKLAMALNVSVGDEVSLRIEKPGILPLSAPLASQKKDQSVRGRFSVGQILSDYELGPFSLSANQIIPYNAFVHSTWLEERAELTGKANLIVAGDNEPGLKFAQTWEPADLGLTFRQVESVVQLESAGIYLEPEAARAALSLPEAQASLTYLVNSISKGGAKTPYSFVQAKDKIGLNKNEIIINRWLSDELKADIGNTVSVKYSELLPSNRFKERERKFIVKRIVEMSELEQERELAPRFPGLTDVDRCTDWDVGIPMQEEELEDKKNEAYWDQYRQTPKAIVSLESGQDMWSNQFGSLTAVRWANDDGAEAAFQKEYSPAAAGFIFQPVREQALAAVDNALDFGQLFIGMSFFLIIAALMLTGLLFVFGVQQRAEEMGVLLATGWRSGTVLKLVWAEGGGLAFAGSIFGALAGAGYTKLLILGLSRYWKGAVANSAIQYCAETQTMMMGIVASFLCALMAMRFAVWRQVKSPARELLMADYSQSPVQGQRRTKALKGLVAFICGLGAVGIVVHALVADVQSVALPFFGAGALLLISGVLLCGVLLQRTGSQQSLTGVRAIATKNMTRRQGRSLIVVGLLASGCFLVFAVSSMKEDIAAHAHEPWSGTGGFKWFGESTLPITDALGGVRLRVRDGDDASCLNLNRAQSPRLLGVDPDIMSEHQAFMSDEDVWQLLKLEMPEGIIPALVGDSDTAAWGLEAKTGIEIGDEIEYRDEAGKTFRVRLVGKLPMRLSVFQGTLLIAEQYFVKRFPSEAGWRIFLWRMVREPAPQIRDFLGRYGLRDGAEQAVMQKYNRAGLNIVPSVERLMEFYTVESTYLAMFLVLGALGLIVGSMGMGIVVLRNVQDRRSEIALLRAVGYKKITVQNVLLLEHSLLLCLGLGVGIIAAAVAMLPVMLSATSAVPYTLLFIMLISILGCGAVCIASAIGVALQGDAMKALRNE